MIITTTVEQLREELSKQKSAGTIGFVPTMGALHEGHLSLVDKAASENGSTVVSIFVNPTQFNDPDDLRRYPRNPQADLEKLEKSRATLIFMPEVEEIYPEPDTRVFDFKHLDTIMEGRYRPGHFNGVAQVVSKLFEIVNPDKAYFGLKDFQQLAIIKQMVKICKMSVEIVACPTVREPDGLAMSSRNKLLSEDERQEAVKIFKFLKKAAELKPETDIDEIKSMVINSLNKSPLLTVEYFEIVDGSSLQSVSSWDESDDIVGTIAVHCGAVRLIDNIQFF